MTVKKIHKGELFSKALTSDAYNSFADAANAHKRSGGAAHKGDSFRHKETGLVKVKNSTGSDLSRFSIVGLGSPIIDPTDNQNEFENVINFTGVSPTEGEPFAVLQEPLADGKIGIGLVQGVTPVSLSVTDTDHAYADAATATTSTLASGDTGSVQILWKETGTGTKQAYVRLSNGHPESGGSGGGSGETGTVPNTDLYGKANENWQQGGDSGGEDMSAGNTATATLGSDEIVGSAGCLFLTELTLGQELILDGSVYNVIAITDNTHGTLDRDFEGTTGAYSVSKPAVSPTPSTPWVRVNPCDDIVGTNPDYTTTNVVYWANYSPNGSKNAEDPNVENQQVIGYQVGPDSQCFTEGYQDGKIGDAIFQTRTYDTKQGWGRMDGNDNSVSNGGTGIIMSCFFPRGSEGTEAIGVQKGQKDHYHSTYISTTPTLDILDSALWQTPDPSPHTTIHEVPEGDLCSTTNKDQADCECAGQECDCEADAEDGNQCKLPIQYVHLHYMERLDTSQGYTPPA